MARVTQADLANVAHMLQRILDDRAVVMPENREPPSSDDPGVQMFVRVKDFLSAEIRRMDTPEPRADAGVEISLRIGQRVRHKDHDGRRVTGKVIALSVDNDDGALKADIALDAAIVIPPLNADDRELLIWRQYVLAHELTPFDDRDELIDALVRELKHAAHWFDQLTPVDAERYRAAIAKATGSAE